MKNEKRLPVRMEKSIDSRLWEVKNSIIQGLRYYINVQEKSVKTSLAYHFSEKYGADQDKY